MCGLFCVVLAAVLLWGGAWFGMKALCFLLLVYLGRGLYKQLPVFLRPPRMSLQRGVFSIRLDSTLKTPAANLSYLGVDHGKLRIGFRDATLVDFSQGQSPPATPQYGRQGIELTTSGEIFTLDKVNKIRRALGQAEQLGDANPDELSQFRATLDATTPYAFVTPTIIVVNVVVFVALWLSSGAFLLPRVETLVQWGANCVPETTTGEWWRLFTSMFLHFGILHILFNMWVLWGIGRLVERFVGNVAFAVSYLAAGFLGSVASVLWSDGIVSAGASGAVFGVFGVLVGFMSLHRKSIPIEAIKRHRNSALAFLAFNLFFGIQWQLNKSEVMPGVDMAAHVGGLVAGFACGLLLSQEISAKATAARWVRTALLTVIALVVCGASVYFLPVRAGNLTYYARRVKARDSQIYNETLKQLERQKISPSEARARIESDIVADYARRRSNFEKTAATMAKPQADFDRLLEYVRVRGEAWSLAAELITDQDPLTKAMAEEQFEEAEAIVEEGNTQPEQ
jgi:membrane associated rhomboid family serine protease